MGKPRKPIRENDLGSHLKPGTALRFWYNENNPNNRLWHVRAVVDDEMIVCRVWFRHKQRWRYRVDHVSWFEMAARSGSLFEE